MRVVAGPNRLPEYRNLVEKRNVDAIVGYISSGNCQALALIAEELKQFTIFATVARRVFLKKLAETCVPYNGSCDV